MVAPKRLACKPERSVDLGPNSWGSTSLKKNGEDQRAPLEDC